MPETPFTESEAILYAVREDEEGLEAYLADRARFTEGELHALRSAASALSAACSDELRDRTRSEPV